jgi:ribosomal protein L37AE/L43A
MSAKARPKCPDCHKQLRVKALTDSDQRIWSKWRYCEDCGWDERGKFEVTVWGQEGDIVKKVWEANQSEVDAIEEEYGDDPMLIIMVDPLPQNELPRS